ncbi:hypothetical protein ACPWR0_09345 [Pandoraea pneumonica]|uniref:hypothetical protein n=1 Tax=Pandoraea pneumonica TaxID=2508299 RepID=UPI003CEC9ACE
MTFLFLRRHALTVPAALSVVFALTAPPASAAPETASAPAAAALNSPANDPANADAPSGPIAKPGVMHDFARPALSVAPSDWRAVNADVSGGGQMDHAAMGHAMPMPAAASSAHDPHAGHNMSGGTR